MYVFIRVLSEFSNVRRDVKTPNFPTISWSDASKLPTLQLEPEKSRRTAATPQMVTMNPCFRLLFRCEPTLQVVPRPTIGRKTMFCSHSSHNSTLQTNSGPFTLHPTVCPVLTSFICQSPYPPPVPYTRPLLTYLLFRSPNSLSTPGFQAPTVTAGAVLN
jgi:hypothetical protein